MPIIASTPADLKRPIQIQGPTFLKPAQVTATAPVSQTAPQVELGRLQQINSEVDSSGFLTVFEVDFSSLGSLALHSTSIETLGTLRDFEVDLGMFTPLQLVVGIVPPKVNPFRASTPLVQTQNYNILFHRTPVSLLQRFLYGTGPLITTSGGISSIEDLVLVDLLGPQIFNEIPVGGSSFNDPLTEVTFDLIDTGGSDVSLSGTQIYVDGTLVIDSGADVTPSGFGVTTFTPISSSFYQFEFISTLPYGADYPITISGRSSDTTPSGNVEYFNYDFNVWKTADLAASIVGLADTIPPFLDSLNPGTFQTEVPVDSEILLTINDLHTGVDEGSIILSIGSETVYSGSQDLTTSYNISRTTTGDGRGFNFTINPTSNLEFSKEVQVGVFASDLFDPVNSLDTSYSFFTIENVHLVASGLQVLQDTVFEDMEIESSYITASSTKFHITYLNTSGTGISTSGSSVLLDGVEIPSVITQVSGSLLAYDVFFELAPDYTDDADLVFHIQQSGTVSGIILDRDFSTELLWGYEFCYDKEELPHDTELIYSVRVCDNGQKPTLSAFVKSFTTVPLDSNSLFAQIVPVDPPSQEISASLTSNNTFFEFGKTMFLELDVEDFAGNKRTFAWNFTIEDE